MKKELEGEELDKAISSLYSLAETWGVDVVQSVILEHDLKPQNIQDFERLEQLIESYAVKKMNEILQSMEKTKNNEENRPT